MEKQDASVAIDSQEIKSPSDHSPAAAAHDEIRSTTRNFLEPEEKKPPLAQRLADAFREGVASTKPDYDKRPEVRIPPPVKKNRQESSDTGVLDRVIQEGGSAAAAVGDKAAGVLDSVVELVKKAPDMLHKYVEAFREGAALVKPREGRERREVLPPSAKKNGSPSDGRVILDRVFHAGASAAKIVRGTVAAVKPGEVSGAGRKIRRCKKKIGNLYIEIGREVVNSWGNGPVETEKVAELLDQLRKNEEEIQNLQEHIAEVAAARKTKAAGSQQAAKEAVFTPVSDKEDISFDAGVSGAKLGEQVYNPGDWQQPESSEGGDFAVEETSVSAAPEAESPASDKLVSDKEDISFDAGVSGAKLGEQVYNPGDWQQPESSEGGDFAVEETSVSTALEAESPASPPAPKHTVTVKKLRRRKK